jgi:hypothetical protein
VGTVGGDRPVSFTSEEEEAELWCGSVSFDCFVWDCLFLCVFSPPLSPLLSLLLFDCWICLVGGREGGNRLRGVSFCPGGNVDFGGLVRGRLVVVVERGGSWESGGSEGRLSFNPEREREKAGSLGERCEMRGTVKRIEGGH